MLCLPGHYCSREGLAEPEGLCDPGWFCELGSWSPRPVGLGNDTIGECKCLDGRTGGKCLAGSYCPAGADAPIQCDGGKYCDASGLSAVSGDCLAGYYCNGSTIISNPVNDTTGDVCPQGHYCPTGSSYPIPCDPGYYTDHFANQNESNCLLCTAGSYCSAYGMPLPDDLCDAGWYCPEGMTTPQPPSYQCLAGHKCPRGSPDQMPCPSGSYQPNVGEAACLECPSGMYCDQNEAISELQSGVAAPSHGVVTPKDCPAGFYCPNGTMTARQTPCPSGTYSNTTSLGALSECRMCTPGYFCDTSNLTEPAGLCDPGYYCVLGAESPAPTLAADWGPCPQGTYCEEGAHTPIPCPKGTYGDRDRLPSLADCVICPPGEFCSHSGLTASNGSCLAGYYCNNGSSEQNPVGQLYGDECPSGSYCPEHSYQPSACPAGTYQPYTQRTNISACLECDPGKFCNSTSLSAVSGDCYEGFYCSGGASSPSPLDGLTGDICPVGSYCPEGSYTHNYCGNGTYTNHTGSTVCYECPEGYYCDSRVRADSCLPGYYCPAGTGANLQPCPVGTYNPAWGIRDISECTQCDGGSYCDVPGQSSTAGNCSAGYYCTSGV